MRRTDARPLRVAPAWVGAATPGTALTDLSQVPARDALWAGTLRRFARAALWALPASAIAYGWTTLARGEGPLPLAAHLAATWLGLIALVALTGLLAGTRPRRLAVTGLLVGLAGAVLLPFAGLPPEALAGAPLPAAFGAVAFGLYGAGWLLAGAAVLRSRLLNPADGILLMLAAATIGAGRYAVSPLPTVGALLMLAAGMGIAWCGARLVSRL